MGALGCQPGKFQLAILFPSQQGPWNAAVVDLGAEEHDFALDHVLSLQPVARGTTAIEALDPLGNDPLQPQLGRSLEELATGERGNGTPAKGRWGGVRW
jgi:hypothetical protein